MQYTIPHMTRVFDHCQDSEKICRLGAGCASCTEVLDDMQTIREVGIESSAQSDGEAERGPALLSSLGSLMTISEYAPRHVSVQSI